jgi:hypothetical protein
MKVFEKIAFSLVILFGLMCFAVVVYGHSPDARDLVQEAMQSEWLTATCAQSPIDTCTTYLLN